MAWKERERYCSFIHSFTGSFIHLFGIHAAFLPFFCPSLPPAWPPLSPPPSTERDKAHWSHPERGIYCHLHTAVSGGWGVGAPTPWRQELSGSIAFLSFLQCMWLSDDTNSLSDSGGRGCYPRRLQRGGDLRPLKAYKQSECKEERWLCSSAKSSLPLTKQQEWYLIFIETLWHRGFYPILINWKLKFRVAKWLPWGHTMSGSGVWPQAVWLQGSCVLLYSMLTLSNSNAVSIQLWVFLVKKRSVAGSNALSVYLLAAGHNVLKLSN